VGSREFVLTSVCQSFCLLHVYVCILEGCSGLVSLLGGGMA